MGARISLCMILRDEEAMLPRFLAAVRGAWDELVAVDTGSKDRTPALLREAGARVLASPWADDFAAPRNAGLAAATGDFALVLDADELASAAFVAGLREAVADPRLGAATLAMRNALPHGHARVDRLLRVFRRDPAIRFRHAIHESADEDVLAFLARTGLRVRHLPGEVEHLGYARDRAAARGKRARDAAILQRCLAEDPDDLYSYFKLLEQARFWRDRALWSSAAAAAVDAMARSPERLARAHFGGELAALVAEGLHPGDPRAELAALTRWRQTVSPSAALELRRGLAAEGLGLAAHAAEAYAAGLALASGEGVLQLTGVRPRLGLARLALGRGDVDEARARVAAALGEAPRDPEALLAAASLACAAGREGLLAFRRAHAAAHGDTPELDAGVGEAALLAGWSEVALGALGAAAGDPPRGPAALLLGHALLAAGDLTAARALCASIAEDEPAAALGVLLCDVAEGRSSVVEVELEPDEADRELRRWVAAIRAGRCAPLLAALRARAHGVAATFPWLPATLA